MYKCIPLLVFIASCGCSPSPPRTVVSKTASTVVVSGEEQSITLNDGTQIGVDGILAGQSMALQVLETENADGDFVVDIDLPATGE